MAALMTLLPAGAQADSSTLAGSLPLKPSVELLSQAPAAANQQGNQVVVNGQPLTLPWRLRAGRLGLADFGLLQDFGFELLDSASPSTQPVRWFSDTVAAPIVLNSWLEGGYRFLDITDLAQRYGWQIQPSGASLRISVPVVQIQGIRRSRQDWGDRIVVDLSGPATWGVRESEGEFTVILDALGANPANVSAIATQPGNLLTALQVTPTANNTQIRGTIDRTARPRVSTLAGPPRLVIDVRRDDLAPRNITWAPGLRWQQQYLTVSGRAFPVYWLEVNPRQAGLSLRPIWTDPVTATGTAPLITTAQRWQAAAAINAGFFNRNNQYPLGAIRRDGQWISGPILGRGAIAWDTAGNVLIDRLALNQTIATDRGQQFPLQTFNSGYVGAGIGLYTPSWGPTYTSILDNEVLVTVVNDQVVSQQPTGASGSTTIAIPANGYLLAVRANPTALTALAPGVRLSRQDQTLPADFGNYPQIVAGGPLLVKNRTIVLNAAAEGFSESFATQSAVRSAIGVTDRGTLLLVTLHFSPGGRGATLPEMAQVMQQLGSVHALNLDGGSSSSLYLGGQLLNRIPRTAARVHNGIGIFLQP
ncbi:phosphodiester glycosidase family protein [Pseudanabaena sp. FACHB-2040]|uniref:phosphodiester glycosidase family protein n=1 Tax=Pseudanabaena sp. FACHB-2040 TaxID=2692859 RepID=UPI0018F00A5D|nr:phosphodiester glycosidase family protein [Pseudanabaena sp. FACHB-2040]